jgi:tRNA threonylcarbamoyladenosine modification (KEOPS) complex  Pcc1 subunit
MRSSITIKRDYGGNGLAKKVLKALQPDNREVPVNTTIKMNVEGGSLLIEIKSTGNLPSFLRTVDDLLLCLQAAEGAAKGAC